MAEQTHKPGIIYAPFTPEQVRILNMFQENGIWFPFTCGNDECRDLLVAHENGWRCSRCDYTQNWAHAIMADETAVTERTRIFQAATKATSSK